MIQICYSEMDGPHGPTCRLEAAGHAGYAPAGQDMVCRGASLMMQSLAALLAGQADAKSDAWDEPEGPRLAVSAAAPQEPWVEGAFELAKQSAALLAERYPDHVKFADTSRRAKQGMVDLQLFAEQAAPDAAPPALSRAQAQQAAASGTLKRTADEGQPRLRSRPSRCSRKQSSRPLHRPGLRCRSVRIWRAGLSGSSTPAGRPRRRCCAAASRGSACKRNCSTRRCVG